MDGGGARQGVPFPPPPSSAKAVGPSAAGRHGTAQLAYYPDGGGQDTAGTAFPMTAGFPVEACLLCGGQGG
ncbi:MAG: hypothetical protein N3E46_07435 [Gemmataceae bacterium]|nr:hypothetical protein [Gemmataceae bacterium]